MAAAAVTSLKMEPGVKVAESRRLMYTPSGATGSLSMGSTAGDETMQMSSPVR